MRIDALTAEVGDTVVFSTDRGTVEGRVVKTYSGDYIKIRYRVFGIIPVYRIDRYWRMLSHKPKGESQL
jgi:hypothetical protein